MSSAATKLFIILLFIWKTNGQFNVSDSINSFSVNLLAATNSEAGESLNIAFSPFTVWNLLAIIEEGARGNTAKQLETSLQIPNDRNVVRNNYRSLRNSLLKQTPGVELEISNGLFIHKSFPLKPNFERAVTQFYDVQITSVDFKNPNSATQAINRQVASATRNRIPQLVSPSDTDANNIFIFLTSVLFFKGQWRMPFNKTATTKDAFFDEKNNKIGDVNMMYQVGFFPFSRIESLKAYAVELPYGNGEKSMVILLPFKGVATVSSVLNSLSRMKFSQILKQLDDTEKMYVDEEVHVYLPKFKITSDVNLNKVLDKMGIKDLFESQKADLLDMAHHYLYVSRIIQKAEIEVDEEGTVAAAASAASFFNKSTPPVIRANHPFLYFIVDKHNKSILFCGKVSNPKTL